MVSASVPRSMARWEVFGRLSSGNSRVLVAGMHPITDQRPTMNPPQRCSLLWKSIRIRVVDTGRETLTLLDFPEYKPESIKQSPVYGYELKNYEPS